MSGRILLPLLFVTLAPSFAQTGLGLSPMRIELTSQPGEVHSGALDITTDSAGPVRFRGELLDFFVDATMTPQFSRQLPAEASYSCRSWLAVNPMEAEVGPAQHVLARYTLRVPADAAPRSYYCAVGFTALPSAEQLRQSGFRTTVRVVAVFYVIVGDPPARGGLEELALEPVPGSGNPQWRAVLTVRNDGDRHLRPLGHVEVQGCSGDVLERAAIPSFPALPRRSQKYFVLLQTADRQRICGLRVSVDLGSHEILQASVAVPPSR
ncbi:MAG: hypothetical protein N2036_07430 [Bryobacteraceae bacterium]|nr:hypothetical protein [Bryobacteraceae bacterium]